MSDGRQLVPIVDQVAEAEKAFVLRIKEIREQVDGGRMRQASADLHLMKLNAARETLVFIARNADALRAFIRANRESQS